MRKREYEAGGGLLFFLLELGLSSISYWWKEEVDLESLCVVCVRGDHDDAEEEEGEVRWR
jgi:hypothetical protein